MFETKYIEQFVKGKKEMSKEDAAAYLSELETEEYSERKDERIRKLSRYISRLDRALAAKVEIDRQNMVWMVGYGDFTKKWEASGAYWRALGSICWKWCYGSDDNVFLTCWSGTTAEDAYNLAVIADKEFEKMKEV